MSIFISALLAASTQAPLTQGAQIERPVFESPVTDKEFGKCLLSEFLKQAPQGLFGSGEAYIAGISVKRDYTPVGAAYTIQILAPNSQRAPRFQNTSIVLETPDRSRWELQDLGNGRTQYRASAVKNPAIVFDRAQIKYLFDFDLSSCVHASN